MNNKKLRVELLFSDGSTSYSTWGDRLKFSNHPIKWRKRFTLYSDWNFF
jgi:hypothetical protein